MFFAKPGKYEPCGMFSIGHLILFVITMVVVILLVKNTMKCKKENVLKIIKISTIVLWILEVIKIIFNFAVGNAKNPNNYIPLYYCSLVLYAGLLSSFSKGILKKIGDVFIATGCIIGGLFFLCCPNTSLTMYPMFHYISIQSFIFHGTMLYLGILVNTTEYVELRIKDIKYYATLIMIISCISYIVNNILNTNFMFISKNFPGTPVEVVYNNTGKLFSFIMVLTQTIGPFLVVYLIRYLFNKFFVKSEQCEREKITV